MERQRSVNGASTIFDPASWVIKWQWNLINPQWIYPQTVLAKMVMLILHPPPTIERPHSVNNFCGGSVSYTAMHCTALFPSWVLSGQFFPYVLVYNFTNMHAVSHRTDFFTCSSRVNLSESAVCGTKTLLSAVSQVRLRSCLLPTAMLDSKSLDTTLLEVVSSSENVCVFIRYLSDYTLQIVFDAWWASMNVGSNCPIAWNDSRYASSWQFYWCCGIEKTGSPQIVWIVCHQVLRHPSDHGTSSMENQLLAKAHIAKLNKSTVRGYWID